MQTIYYYGIDNNKSGMEIYAKNLIANISKKTKKYHFHIITQFEDFYFKNELVNKYNCSFTVVPKYKKHPFKYTKAVYKILKNHKENDILQINLMSYRNVFLLHAAKKSKIKSIIVGHSTNTNNLFEKFQHYIGRFIFRKYGTKVANNKKVVSYLYGKKSPTHIIELGIDKSNFVFNESKRSEIRKNLKCDNKFVIGNVGRISKQKNQIFLIKVMSLLANYDDIELFLLGNGSEKQIIKIINKYKLKNVHLLGQVENIHDFYNAFDLFVFPSIFESAGFALYEALTNGCPSIISDKIPLDGLALDNVKVLKLKISEWKQAIINEKNNQFSSRTTNLFASPSIEKQINDYLYLYDTLTK